MLSVEHLSIAHKNHQVLDDFNLRLESGEIFALLGDSGCGKSSALRFIAGLDSTTKGNVNLDGQSLTRSGKHQIQPEHRQIGMVFQDYSLFPHMTIEKNIAFGLSDKTRQQKRQKVKDLLSLINLERIEKKYPHQLSGGEQQRVALARALAPSPKLLLLDEPFSNLDKKHRDKLVKQVRNILKQSKVTSILVTHDQDEAYTLADKVGKIKHKRLELTQI